VGEGVVLCDPPADRTTDDDKIMFCVVVVVVSVTVGVRRGVGGVTCFRWCGGTHPQSCGEKTLLS